MFSYRIDNQRTKKPQLSLDYLMSVLNDIDVKDKFHFEIIIYPNGNFKISGIACASGYADFTWYMNFTRNRFSSFSRGDWQPVHFDNLKRIMVDRWRSMKPVTTQHHNCFVLRFK